MNSLKQMSNAQPEPCRRRAIWAAQAEVSNAVQPKIKHEEVKAVENSDEKDADEAVQVNPHKCDKCGKEVRRGMYFHRKYCKG